MTITNKKLVKEIKNIISASDSARKLAVAEIDKIDAKYKALAEKEKKSLNDTINFLNAQIERYRTLMSNEEGGVQEEETPKEEPAENTASEEESVVDALFPDSLDESVKEETEEPEESPEVKNDNSSDILWPEEMEGKVDGAPEWPEDEEEEAESDGTEATDGDDWPEEPEEWNN